MFVGITLSLDNDLIRIIYAHHVHNLLQSEAKLYCNGLRFVQHRSLCDDQVAKYSSDIKNISPGQQIFHRYININK